MLFKDAINWAAPPKPALSLMLYSRQYANSPNQLFSFSIAPLSPLELQEMGQDRNRWQPLPNRPRLPNPHQRLRQESERRLQECGWCIGRRTHEGMSTISAKGHTISNCAWPSERGDIPGCPRCNTTEHCFDNCPRAGRYLSQLAESHEAWTFLVRNRGSLPPLRTTRPWPDLAVNNPDNPTHGYPATKAFVLAQFATHRSRFREYLRRPCLPFLADPATATLDMIRQNLDVLRLSEVYVQQGNPTLAIAPHPPPTPSAPQVISRQSPGQANIENEDEGEELHHMLLEDIEEPNFGPENREGGALTFMYSDLIVPR